MEEWGYSSTILNLDIKWRWVIILTLRPPYSSAKNPRYSLDNRLGGPQSRSVRCGVENNLLTLRESNLGRQTNSQKLYRLTKSCVGTVNITTGFKILRPVTYFIVHKNTIRRQIAEGQAGNVEFVWLENLFLAHSLSWSNGRTNKNKKRNFDWIANA
jgi:hypothetical protein